MRRRKVMLAVAAAGTALAGTQALPAEAQDPPPYYYYCVPGSPTAPYYCTPPNNNPNPTPTATASPTVSATPTATATVTPPDDDDDRPRKRKPRVTITVSPKVDRSLPVAYRAKGRLRNAAVASIAQSSRRRACRGRINVVVKRGKRRVARKVTRVRRNCRYSARVKVKRRKLAAKGRGRLKVVTRFRGNSRLRKDSSRTVRVRYRVPRRR